MTKYMARIVTTEDSFVFPYIFAETEEDAEMIATRRFIMEYGIKATFSIMAVMVEDMGDDHV